MPDVSIPPATAARPVWLRVGTLFDGLAAPLHNAHLVYTAAAILYVGSDPPPRTLLRPGQSRPDAEMPDDTLLPGLVEAHAHLFLQGGELDAQRRAAYLGQTPQILLRRARGRLARLVRLGIIGVRDAGDNAGVGLALSKLSRSGTEPLMPYVDSPGAAIHRRARYGAFMAEPLEDYPSPAACVAARLAAGADRIKIIATDVVDLRSGAVLTPPQLTAQEIREIVREANAAGRQVFAHASGEEGIEQVIEGGVDSVEHGFFVREDQLGRMADRHIAWVPTASPMLQQREYAETIGREPKLLSRLRKILDGHAASMRRAAALGVTLIAGSDAGSYGVAHGIGLLEELEWMEEAGLSPLAVLAAATGSSAARLAFQEPFGQIRPGYRSRFLLTRHSPLESVSNLRKPKRVIYDGAVIPRTAAVAVEGL